MLQQQMLQKQRQQQLIRQRLQQQSMMNRMGGEAGMYQQQGPQFPMSQQGETTFIIPLVSPHPWDEGTAVPYEPRVYDGFTCIHVIML